MYVGLRRPVRTTVTRVDIWDFIGTLSQGLGESMSNSVMTDGSLGGSLGRPIKYHWVVLLSILGSLSVWVGV